LQKNFAPVFGEKELTLDELTQLEALHILPALDRL
jgi:hypothetical protein